MTSIWDTIKADLVAEEQEIVAFAKNLITANVVAIVPIAKAAVAGLVASEVAQVASGNTSQTGHTLADAVKATESAVVQAGIQATAGEILTAVGVAKQ